MKALSPAAKGRLGDNNDLAGLRLCKLLLAKPCIVSPTTKGRIWRYAACLLELRAAWIGQDGQERVPADPRDQSPQGRAW